MNWRYRDGQNAQEHERIFRTRNKGDKLYNYRKRLPVSSLKIAMMPVTIQRLMKKKFTLYLVVFGGHMKK